MIWPCLWPCSSNQQSTSPPLCLISAADDVELVAAVAVEVHDPGQGEVVLLARRPERGEDLVAGHDRIGELVVEDAGLGRVIAFDARDLDRALLDGLGGAGRSAE